ncbi:MULTISPECIES: hypothetical protein [Shewanella]|uniref:hypothetical protein n=1 Tax=Shewanella TaxID=22 RepID=UPI00217D0C7A|nr:hypothetical protein [Shewanella xiamenensis]MCT8869271.1 hypothetical protein [Shewanella xiamenensis]MCT8873886.1 hypothetical protein [Shewanella xiamenensis]MCT8877552.1 hypothetical protein [Shewanella xiamenensis]UWH39986.1 hypothetical protein KXJ80_00345 [Shewanella xiamenensis]
MNNSNQATRQNSIVFTGNVSQVKPLENGGAAISLAYNEGSMINGQWETKDTLFLESYLPAKLNFIPNVGDKMTISGFMASNNYQPQGGKKKFGVRIVVNEITEYSPKQASQQQHAPQQQYAPQQGSYQHQPAPQNAPQQHAPQQGGYQNRPAPQNAPRQGGYQNRPAPQNAPQQNAPRQGGYQNRPAPQNAPQQYAPQQGGYQNRPAPQNAPQQYAPQQGSYQNRPAQQQGGFQNGGGFGH